MTEKKTFKNVSSVINSFEPEHTWLVEGFRLESNVFTHREWDMEVTFTRKLKPITVGSAVRYSRWGQEDYTVTVLAFHDGAYWVQHEDGAYTTVAADDLIR
jgi:hypothetical protein